MGAITSLDHYAQLMTGGGAVEPEVLWVWKDSLIDSTSDVMPNMVLGYHNSMWRNVGNPGPGAIPTAVEACSKATAGAIPFTNASGGREKLLLGGAVLQFSLAVVKLYDRLLHIGGLDATLTDPQVVGGTITRNTGGVGNQIWLEIYDTLGANTGVSISANYTNQDGTSGRTTPYRTIGQTGFREIGRMSMLPLQAGDTGVQSVEGVTLTGTTGAAGNFGITIAKPLASFSGPTGISLTGGMGNVSNYVMGKPQKIVIPDDACLALMVSQGQAQIQEVFAMLSTVEV